MKASDAVFLSEAHRSMTEVSTLHNRILALIKAEALLGKRTLKNPFLGASPSQVKELETILISQGYTITTRTHEPGPTSWSDLVTEISW